MSLIQTGKVYMAEENEQEAAVMRITARYVAELQAGKQPRLSDYLARYPQYADAISEFVTYYHAVEADVPGEPANMPALSEVSQLALGRAWERVTQPVEEPLAGTLTGRQSSLLEAARNQHLPLSQLAAALDLSTDIAAMLVAVSTVGTRMIEPSTIPQEVFRRLAKVLQQPLSAILAYFRLSEQPQAMVAETPSPYQIEDQTLHQTQSFRQAVEGSSELSGSQKAFWREILEREGM
jgi:hypothetical protein